MLDFFVLSIYNFNVQKGSGIDFPSRLKVGVTCASGLEKCLKKELTRLGYPPAPVVNGLAVFEGDGAAVARLNVNLRTADRVYIIAGEFPAVSFDMLFEGVKTVEWEKFIPADGKFTVNGKCVKSRLFSVADCQRIIKKAASERLCAKYGLNRLPEDGAEYFVHFSIYKDSVLLMIDTSGEGLHKRGYRDLVGIAPMRETLAAGLVLMSDFYRERPFADPFCGSGTIAIEAAMIACNIAPGLKRGFAFERWNNFDGKFIERAREEAADRQYNGVKPLIFGSDISPEAIRLSIRHARRAGVLDSVRFEVKDAADFAPRFSEGTIVTNPPYGERVIGRAKADECYKGLGGALKKYPGWSLFLITAARDFEKHFGKKCDREKKIFNSNRECRYYYYYGKKTEKKI